MKRYKLEQGWWITMELNGERVVGRTTVDNQVVYITSYGVSGKIPFDKVKFPARLFFNEAFNTSIGARPRPNDRLS